MPKRAQSHQGPRQIEHWKGSRKGAPRQGAHGGKGAARSKKGKRSR